MLNFILGPSGSGKSQQMLAALRARAERGERSILIVPEQFTSSTEGVLFRTLGDSLSAYVESYSFTSLSEALLRRYGGAAVPTLTEAGRALAERTVGGVIVAEQRAITDMGLADCELYYTLGQKHMACLRREFERMEGKKQEQL